MSEPFTFERLTPRQREVIIRKAEGKTYGQVAYELGRHRADRQEPSGPRVREARGRAPDRGSAHPRLAARSRRIPAGEWPARPTGAARAGAVIRLTSVRSRARSLDASQVIPRVGGRQGSTPPGTESDGPLADRDRPGEPQHHRDELRRPFVAPPRPAAHQLLDLVDERVRNRHSRAEQQDLLVGHQLRPESLEPGQQLPDPKSKFVSWM